MRRNLILALAVSSVGSAAFAQLRIVTMNASNYQSSNAQPRTGMNTILQYIGSTISDDPRLAGNSGIAKPIDVLCLQEVFTPQTTLAGYAALLNQIHGVTTYRAGTVSGATSGNGTQGIVYNSATVQLLGETAVGTVSSTGMARQQVRHHIRPVGYTISTLSDIYIYNGHWKSGDSDSARRAVEANTLRDHAFLTAPANANVIYLGDFNVPSSSDAGYAALTSTGATRAFDPINAPGNWSGNSSFRNVHTQSPWSSALNPGFNGATGGMDDRYDHQAITANLNDGEGVAYIPNSYFVAGNNGSHQLNQPLNTGSGASPEVLTQLSSILDHLPVVADYQLRARAVATVTVPAPPQVIVGAATTATVRVQNTAPVVTSNGADELDYTIAISGSPFWSGSFTGSTLATTAGNTHAFTLNTSTPGNKGTPLIFVNQGMVTEESVSINLANTTVLAHATPSLSASAIATSDTIDLGVWAIGSTPTMPPAAVSNRADASGFTAGLDIDAVNATGATATLGLSLATGGAPIAPGATRDATISLSTLAAGSFSSVYTVQSSDQNLPGAIARGDLTLTLLARVALGGDADLSGTVNITDFAVLASNFNEGSQSWADGDFNRDGIVNISDFAVLAANFNQSASELPRTSVPEPGAFAVTGIGLVTLTKRKRRATLGA